MPRKAVTLVKVSFWTKDGSWIWPKVGRFYVSGRKSALFVPGLYLSYRETLEVPTLHKEWFWLERVSWIWSKVNVFKFKVEKNWNNFLSYGEMWMLLLHINIALGK